MSNSPAVLLVALLLGSLAAWSESPSRAHERASAPAAAVIQPGRQVLFVDPMLGIVKMRPVYTRSNRFGAPVAVVQRPVSVDQIKTVRPGSWR